jgi:DNA-binding transcriptional ArsR family regulator
MSLASRRDETRKYRPASAFLSARAPTLSRMFSALGNETRLLILYHLMENDKMKASDLVEAIGVSRSALSGHLGKLTAEQLVGSRKDGQTTIYWISDSRLTTLLNML